ncbi:hypothetical protein GpartN1_g1214.t1 [Galdieria partita]|uniref:Uncharacterized protein n=1 Tax=Galdieria partita TaxID=83374 RepID=A0A9C7PRK7_9RHOD|nr:hypothetical protein GpartN1_g1214.t1 [Galdieria partita]
MENSQLDSNNSAKLDQEAYREQPMQPAESLKKQTEEQQAEEGQTCKSSYRVLDWSEESLESDSTEPHVFETERALAALTISNKSAGTKLNLKGDERSERRTSSVAEPKSSLTSLRLKGPEDSSKVDKESEEVKEGIKPPLIGLKSKTTTASVGRVKEAFAPKRTTARTVETSAWKEEWFSKGIKAFEISCRSSETKLCEVKDILRLPGLLFVDIDKDTFIAAYRSVEKAQRSITRLSTSLALTVTPIVEAGEKSQKIYLEKCPPSNRPAKTTAVAERLILRSLGFPTATTSRTKVER